MDKDCPQETDTEAKPLPLRAQALYDLLRGHIGKNECCWHSQETLAKELGISRRQVQHWIAYLVERGLIWTKRMCHTKAGRPKNHYFLTHPDARKSAPCDARKSAPCDARKSAPCDARKSAPLSLDELVFNEGEGIEETPPPTAALEISMQIQDPPEEVEREHPQVEALLPYEHAFDALPNEIVGQIEAQVREQRLLYPPESLDPSAFRILCVATMVKWRETGKIPLPEAEFEQGWQAFVREFVKQTGVKDIGFLDRVKERFGPPVKRLYEMERGNLPGARGSTFKPKGINATPEQMLFALDCWLDDPRRETGDWQGRFPREAYRYLPGYITNARRHLAQQESQARMSAAQQQEKEKTPAESQADQSAAQVSLPFAEDLECIKIADVLRESIGAGRFDLWFHGKARLMSGEDGFQLAVPNLFLQDFIKKKFAAELKAAFESVTGSTEFKVVIDPTLCGQRSK